MADPPSFALVRSSLLFLYSLLHPAILTRFVPRFLGFRFSPAHVDPDTSESVCMYTSRCLHVCVCLPVDILVEVAPQFSILVLRGGVNEEEESVGAVCFAFVVFSSALSVLCWRMSDRHGTTRLKACTG